MGEDPVIGVTEVNAELFDTTGTPSNFCEDCEHAPCVGGGRRFCSRRPRFMVVGRLRDEIFDILDGLYANPLYVPMRMAVYAISDQARADHGGVVAAGNSVDALRDLASLRTDLQKLTS